MGVKRHREKGSDYLETLINSLTLDQLRDSLKRLSEDDLPPLKNRADVIDAIKKLNKDDELVSVMLEIESVSPAKHCLMLRYDSDFNVFAFKVDDVLARQSDIPALHFSVAFSSPSNKTITFEHFLQVCDWQTDEYDETIKRKVEKKIRHPITLRLDTKECLAMFFYPGFSQGSGIKHSLRVSYEDALTNIIHKISDKVGIEFKSFPIQSCIKKLAEAESSRVKVIKTDFESNKGKMSLSAPSSKRESVDEYLTNFLSPYIKDDSRDKIHAAVKNALKNTSPDSIALLWLEEDLVTRLSYWNIGAEFLFIWYGRSQSYSYIHRIFNLILTVSKNIESPKASQIFDEFLQGGDNIFKLSQLVSKYQINIGELRKIITDAILAGLIKPVYRINTDEILQECQNDWTGNLVSLKKMFSTESKKRIDGSDPENIEVAFKRIMTEME